MPAMSSTALKAMLQAERADSLGGLTSSALSSERTKAMSYYYGDMTEDMPALEGRSSAVSTDVADTIEGLMPSLMEIFAAGEEVVRFEPVGPEDEDAALQETDYVNHVFMQKNPGFLILYTFIKDALLSKNGIVKVFWETEEREERETYLDQPDDAFAVMAADPDVDVAEHTEHKDEQGQVTHDVTLVRKKSYKCAKVVPVPPEEFGISRRSRNIKDSTYCFHQVRDRTEDDLIRQGYDTAQVKELPSASIYTRQESRARDTVEKDKDNTDAMNTSARIVDVTEHYIVMDYEGTDRASLYRVTTGGDDMTVLTRKGKPDVVPVDVMPFASMTPIIVTHRFFGRSIADIVMDIQKIKTALLRSALDNVYLANNQRLEISETHMHERTLDDLLVNRPGGIVRTKAPGGLTPIPNQPIGDFIYPMLEYIDGTKESRTGVTKQSMGMDADALQNQSATAFNGTMAAVQAKTKLIARILAETGIRDLFALLHGVIRKNDKQENTVRLRNKWVKVDPRNWKTRDDMTINVGLGTGSRAEQVAHLMQILEVQKEVIAAPMPSFQMLVKPKNVYNTLEKLIERVGLKTIEPYFSDPEAVDPATGQPKQPPPPPPDHKTIEVQGKLQIAQQTAQTDAQMQQQKQALETAKVQTGIQADQQKMAMEGEMKQQQMAAEYQLKREQMQAEFQLKREQMAAELVLQREHFQMEHQAKLDAGFYKPKVSASVGNPVRMGGEVG